MKQTGQIQVLLYIAAALKRYTSKKPPQNLIEIQKHLKFKQNPKATEKKKEKKKSEQMKTCFAAWDKGE